MADPQIVPGTSTSISTNGAFQEAPLPEDLRAGTVVAGVTGTATIPDPPPDPSGGLILAELSVRKFLQVQSVLTDLCEERIYEVRLPWKKFKDITDIPQTLLVQGNGGTIQRGAPIIYPDLIIKCFGKNLDKAHELYQALCSVLHDKENLSIEPVPNKILDIFVSVPGQPMFDQLTNWEYIQATFSLIMTNQI